MILPILFATLHITVRPSEVLNQITPDMYGACIEDVNHEIYGGLYGQRIFGESFEEPAPGASPTGWRTYGGNWFPAEDGIHGRGGDGPKLVLNSSPAADGTVEADIALSNDLGENASLLVRVSEPGEGADEFVGYEIALSAKHRQILLGKHRHNFEALRTVDAPLVAGRFNHLRVETSGARIRVFLGEETTPRIDFADERDPILSGQFALRTWQADATFRRIRVNGTPVSVSFATPGVSRPWDRLITGDASAHFALSERAYNGILCQRVEMVGGQGRAGVANRGLNRWGISVRGGKPMVGRIYLRGDVRRATIALQSADGARTYAKETVTVGDGWTKTPFRLTSTTTDPSARFAVWIEQPGRLFIDQAVLTDADGFKGLPVRKDIAQELVDSGVGFLRYGGTMVNVPGYRWKNMIGDPDRRPPYAGQWYPCSTNGFGIFDFMNFCDRAKLHYAFAINAEESAQDAADLADYLTAPTDNPWGKQRAADGHPAPYSPKYIEIGNEEAIGNPDAEAMRHYAERFRILAKAIHGRNPALKLVCAAWWVPDSAAMKTVFDAIDGEAAAWDFHFWCDSPNAGVDIDRELSRAESLFHRWNPKTTLRGVVFEENGNRHDVQRALGHASTLNATRAHGDFILADCAANALQPWRQNDNGWDQGGVFFTPSSTWSMPPALVNRMLAADALAERIACRTDAGLDTLATRSKDGRRLSLTLVNPGEVAIETQIVIEGYSVGSATARSLSGRPDAANTPTASQAIEPLPRPITHGIHSVSLSLPPHSVSSIRISGEPSLK